MIVKMAAVFCIFILGSLGPGGLILRNRPMTPEVKLSCAIALSYGVMFALLFLCFVFHLPQNFHYWILTGNFLCVVASRHDLRRMLSDRHCQSGLFLYGLVILWSLLHLAMLHSFSGGGWAVDWFEHYQRALFVLEKVPDLQTKFVVTYSFTARPPLMNLLASHFLFLIGRDFWIFQLGMFFMNSVVMFPLLLFVPENKSRRLLAVVLMFSPVFMQNMTYSWTRHLANFFVLLSVWLYWNDLCDRKTTNRFLCFLFLSLGSVVHYSAIPYAIGLFLYDLYRNGKRLQVASIRIYTAAAVPFMAWLVWAAVNLGAKSTFLSNTTATDSAKLSLVGNIAKMAANIINTIVPPALRIRENFFLKQQDTLGYLHDYFFLNYQSNLILGGGLTGGILLLCFLFRKRRAAVHSIDRKFWMFFIGFSVLLGICVHGGPSEFGVAHVCLQPVILLGLACLARKLFEWSKPLQITFMLGLLMDYLFGILLHYHQQTFSLSRYFVLNPEMFPFNRQALVNWSYKEKFRLMFFGDFFADYVACLETLSLLAFALVCIYLVRDLFFSRSARRVAG